MRRRLGCVLVPVWMADVSCVTGRLVMAAYRTQLFNIIRDVLYTTTFGSTVPIPSLDLIKIISRVAAPHEQLVVWERSTLHALDMDIGIGGSRTGTGNGGGGDESGREEGAAVC